MKATTMILFAALTATIGISRAAAQEAVSAPTDTTSPAAAVVPAVTIMREETPPPKITEGKPVSLIDALDMAERRNLDLNTAKMEVAKAQANLKKSWGMVLPAVQGKMDYTHMDHADEVDLGSSFAPLLAAMGTTLPPGTSLGEPILVNPQEKLVGSLQVSMPLINAEGWRTIRTARKGVDVAGLAIEQARRQILFGTAQAYYMALTCRDLIDFYHSQIVTAKEQLRIAKARFKAGRAMRIDVIRAETDLTQASQSLLSSELAFDNARDALGQLIGMDGLPLPVTAPALRSPGQADVRLEQRAIAARADVKTGSATADLMKDQLTTAWMRFIPTFNLALQGSYQLAEMAALGSSDRSRWAVMLSLTVPIYNHYRYGDLDEKRAELRQAELALRNTEQKAALSVRKASRDYAVALSSVATAKKQVDLAAEGLKLTESAYLAGTGDSLSVTNARQTYVASGFNLATLELKAELALLTLIDAIGEEIPKNIQSN